MKKSVKKSILLSLITVFFIITYIFCHSTPERSIKSYLFFNGYSVNAFITEVYMCNDDSFAGKYYCKNPGIGPDSIAVKKSNFELWYVDLQNSGGG
ncbi:hypothetical protein [Clostridium sp. C2-6-12]|uniref:hypothetical protein n=1 Tax=Clostridium sp. C2-6-12 TaxID=2698832 RepID=UPI00136B4DE2|nr:hypothetical protein [Clostridium sp. C2-6-12]